MTTEAPTAIAEVIEPEATPVIPFRLVVDGSPTIDNEKLVYHQLDRLTAKRSPDMILSSGAPGPGLMGGAWGLAHNLHVMWFYPQETTLGLNAKLQRNWEMAAFAINEAEGALLAFWDGQTRETRHLIDSARALNMAVRIIRTDEVK